MCYLCLRNNPFDLENLNKVPSFKKKHRAAQIKVLLRDIEANKSCEELKSEVDKLKEEQYLISRDI